MRFLPMVDRAARSVAGLSLGFAVAVSAADLNDTGQIRCYDARGAVRSCTAAPAGDDARFGRDAAAAAGALRKTGAGTAGFDFTKIANNGVDLPAGAALGRHAGDWACTRDNLTGLTWEVKTTDPSDPRYFGHRYWWYNTNPTENGGHAGSVGTFSTCNPAMPQCNTQAFLDAVNRSRLCGHADWRLPTPRELRSIVHYGDVGTGVSVDRTYFPNMLVERSYWSAFTYAPDPRAAWVVEIGGFDGGGAGHSHSKSGNLDIEGTGDEHTLLVRGPQAVPVSGPCSAGVAGANVAVATPSSDFMDHGNGTVTHLSTGLMWRRCAEGATGESCAGGAPLMVSWEDATELAESSTFGGYADWRLPSVKELHSIVETCGYDPAINQSIFPGTPRPHFGSVFWTSTTWASNGSLAWIIVFDRGGGVATEKTSRLFVRLVRGGTSATFDLRNPPRPKRRPVRH